jgi:hypothetical protein
MTAPYTP